MNVIKRINDIIYIFEKFILCGTVIGMFIVLVLNVFARHVFNGGISWAEEVGSMLITILCFIGLSYATRTGTHITMSALVDRVPEEKKKPVILVLNILGMIGMVLIAFLAIKYELAIFRTGRCSPSLMIPLYIPYFSVPLGFILSAFQYFILLLMNFRSKENIYFIDEMDFGDADDAELEEFVEEVMEG